MCGTASKTSPMRWGRRKVVVANSQRPIGLGGAVSRCCQGIPQITKVIPPFPPSPFSPQQTESGLMASCTAFCSLIPKSSEKCPRCGEDTCCAARSTASLKANTSQGNAGRPSSATSTGTQRRDQAQHCRSWQFPDLGGQNHLGGSQWGKRHAFLAKSRMHIRYLSCMAWEGESS